MSDQNHFLLSDLLKHRVRCDQGIDHGIGIVAWMHPPVHRILGWATKPSSIRMSREVWKLDQIRGFSDQQIFVKGLPTSADHATIDRLPTLIDAVLLNERNNSLGKIVDFVL